MSTVLVQGVSQQSYQQQVTRVSIFAKSCQFNEYLPSPPPLGERSVNPRRCLPSVSVVKFPVGNNMVMTISQALSAGLKQQIYLVIKYILCVIGFTFTQLSDWEPIHSRSDFSASPQSPPLSPSLYLWYLFSAFLLLYNFICRISYMCGR